MDEFSGEPPALGRIGFNDQDAQPKLRECRGGGCTGDSAAGDENVDIFLMNRASSHSSFSIVGESSQSGLHLGD